MHLLKKYFYPAVAEWQGKTVAEIKEYGNRLIIAYYQEGKGDHRTFINAPPGAPGIKPASNF